MKKNSLNHVRWEAAKPLNKKKNTLYHFWKTSAEAEGRCGKQEEMKGVIEIGEKKLVVETYSDKMKSGKILSSVEKLFLF